MTDHGMVIRVQSTEIPTLSRATSGVRLMRSTKNSIIDFTVAEHYEEDDEEIEEIPAEEGAAEAEVPAEEAEVKAAEETSAETGNTEDNGQDE